MQDDGEPRIIALDCFDVRFPTSLVHDGSDAMISVNCRIASTLTGRRLR